MRITIVGVGALGSNLVLLLRNVEHEIYVIDYDRVEQKNVASQFHPRNMVGKKKTDSIRQTIQFLFNRKIGTNSNKLTKDNVEQLLQGSGLIIDCLDNGEARRLVQGYAHDNDIPCLHGALSANGEMGRVMWAEEFIIDDAAAGAPTCEDGKHVAFIAKVVSVLSAAAEMFLERGEKSNFHITKNKIFPV